MDRDLLFQFLSGLLALYVTIGVPLLARARVRRFSKRIEAGIPGARVALYRTSIIQQVVMTMIVLGLFWLGRVPPGSVGLGAPRSWVTISIGIPVFVAACVVSGFKMRAKADVVLSKLRNRAGAVIPISPTEARWYAGLASGSGFQEELLYRAFLFYYLASHFPGLPLWAIVLIASAVFGLCHLYQGVGGVLLTGVIGVFFGALYLASGNLILPILLHSLLNLRVLFLVNPPPKPPR